MSADVFTLDAGIEAIRKTADTDGLTHGLFVLWNQKGDRAHVICGSSPPPLHEVIGMLETLKARTIRDSERP